MVVVAVLAEAAAAGPRAVEVAAEVRLEEEVVVPAVAVEVEAPAVEEVEVAE